MELTGKCKEDFEEWYLSDKKPSTMSGKEFVQIWYLTRTESEKWGVYVDFFDSVNIIIELESTSDSWDFLVNGGLECYSFITRQEARIKAIEKANKIYLK